MVGYLFFIHAGVLGPSVLAGTGFVFGWGGMKAGGGCVGPLLDSAGLFFIQGGVFPTEGGPGGGLAASLAFFQGGKLMNKYYYADESLKNKVE